MNVAPPLPKTLRLSNDDNVLVAASRIESGAELGGGIVARARVPFGHKVATVRIARGEPIRKFGQIIGFAKDDIAPGDWVHEHNCGSAVHGAFERDYRFSEGVGRVDFVPEPSGRPSRGIRRANGTVGTRNYVGVLTSVNCSTTVAGFIAKEIERSGMLDDYPNIDGIVALKQANGCVIDYRGVIFDTLKKTTWGYATNPNMGGVIMVGLGCEGLPDPRASRRPMASRRARPSAP